MPRRPRPPPTWRLLSRVVTHSSIPSGECATLKRRGLGQYGCSITYTFTITQINDGSAGTPYASTGGGGGCTSPQVSDYEMQASWGALWGVEQDSYFAVSNCSITSAGVKSCFVQYVLGTTVTVTNCSIGSSAGDGIADSSYSISTAYVVSSEHMGETIYPDDPLHPFYNCHPESCTA